MQKKQKERQFQEIIEQHKGILIKVARTYCRHEEDRDDLIQEMMIQLWRSFHKYDDTFKISTWLYRIALNVAISFYRKNTIRKNKSISLDEDISQIKDLENTGNEQQLKLLELFINELREFDRALMLLYLEDKSHAEIADILGITTGNVGTKMGRIKDKLKQRFSQQNMY